MITKPEIEVQDESDMYIHCMNIGILHVTLKAIY